MIPKVNSCIHFNFYLFAIMSFKSENQKGTEIAILCTDVNVAKYVERSVVVIT